MAVIRAYKCTRSDGTDFYTGTVDYGAALASGEPLTIDAEPMNGKVCGRGLHVSDTPHMTIRFANSEYKPYRWFAVEVEEADVVEKDTEKMRVRRLRVISEITLEDIFGPNFADRIKAVRAEILSWKEIAWLRPTCPVKDEQLGDLFGKWHAAIAPWLRKYKLPLEWRIVRDCKSAADAAAADDDVAVFSADAADAAADASAVAASADDDAAAAASAVAADAASAVAASAVADATNVRLICRRWYVRPRYVLWRYARWRIAGMEQPNPWEPIVRMYLLGAMPIGYVQDKFVIYLPQERGE